MNYVIKIFYQVLGDTVQFEECTVPIHADNKYDAYIQALHIGCNAQKRSKAANGVLLKWHFINVIDIQPLVNNTCRTKTFKTIKPINPQQYMQQMKLKTNTIEAEIIW